MPGGVVLKGIILKIEAPLQGLSCFQALFGGFLSGLLSVGEWPPGKGKKIFKKRALNFIDSPGARDYTCECWWREVV